MFSYVPSLLVKFRLNLKSIWMMGAPRLWKNFSMGCRGALAFESVSTCCLAV